MKLRVDRIEMADKIAFIGAGNMGTGFVKQLHAAGLSGLIGQTPALQNIRRLPGRNRLPQ